MSGEEAVPVSYTHLDVYKRQGVHNADVVVAVNKDRNAPVFAQADYGLVADLHEALPALVEKLS